jgi:hypothetical protein
MKFPNMSQNRARDDAACLMHCTRPDREAGRDAVTIDRIKDINVFVHVAETKSFTMAAEQVGLSRSRSEKASRVWKIGWAFVCCSERREAYR